MSSAPLAAYSKGSVQTNSTTTEPIWVRALLTALALAIVAFVLISLLVVIFSYAFSHGWTGYIAALRDPDAISSIQITLITAAIVVPLNTLFGICAAWSITKFEFWGKNLLITLIDLPFSVSPVISGLVFVLLFGREGIFGAYLHEHHIKIVFTEIGVVLATAFVTFPFVARELIALMQSQGVEEEQAALVLGANGWQIFWHITLPNIKWGLVNGIIICNARSMGEFGAVNVVAGTFLTVPLQVDQYNSDNNLVGAFALASLLALLAIVTLVIKKIVEAATARMHLLPE